MQHPYLQILFLVSFSFFEFTFLSCSLNEEYINAELVLELLWICFYLYSDSLKTEESDNVRIWGKKYLRQLRGKIIHGIFQEFGNCHVLRNYQEKRMWQLPQIATNGLCGNCHGFCGWMIFFFQYFAMAIFKKW